MPEIILWSKARNRELTRYFTGEPCNQGHIDERMVSNRRCVRCLAEHKTRWNKDNPEKLSIQHAHYYHSDPDHREKAIDRSRVYRIVNPEKTNEWKARYRISNPEKCAAAVKRSRAAKPEYYRALNRVQKDARRAGYAKPGWADQMAIKAFYVARGPGQSVDHIIPLGTDKRPAKTADGYPIRGLHIRLNLQYLPLGDNKLKQYRMRPIDQLLCETIP